jgi:hypothetical protein
MTQRPAPRPCAVGVLVECISSGCNRNGPPVGSPPPSTRHTRPSFMCLFSMYVCWRTLTDSETAAAATGPIISFVWIVNDSERMLFCSLCWKKKGFTLSSCCTEIVYNSIKVIVYKIVYSVYKYKRFFSHDGKKGHVCVCIVSSFRERESRAYA